MDIEEQQQQQHELKTNLSVYDMNKQLVKKEIKMSRDKLTKQINTVIRPFTKDGYYMMLCNELRDYTVFIFSGLNDDYDTFQECLEARGFVYSITQTENKQAIEIWIKSHQDSEPHVYYLFNYDQGVVDLR